MNRWLPLAVYCCLPFCWACSASSQDDAPNDGEPGQVWQVKAASKDWPTFRGVNRDGLSTEKGLLKTWPPTGPAMFWKEAAKGIGEGFSSVSVFGDKVFTMGDVGDSSFTFALERATGKKLWEAKVGRSGAPGGYKGTRCTPTVDEELVYALGQGGELVCLQAADGKEVWRKDFRKDFGGSVGGWGYSESPLIDGEKLLCTPGGKDATIVALNKKSGEVIWKCGIPKERAEYASMAIAEVGGIRHYVQLLQYNVVGVAAKDGKLLWNYTKLGDNTANVPTPLVKGDLVFVAAGYGKGGALLKLAAGSDGSVKATEVYYSGELKNRHGGVVLIGKHIYGDKDDSGNPWCADFMTGKTVASWKKQSKGSGSMSIAYADGFLYCRYQNGIVALVEASPNGYRETGSFKIQNTKGPSWPHPVVVDGKLYLREQDMLWCFNVKGK
jgi:outer membrane protein assembly factor BamB